MKPHTRRPFASTLALSVLLLSACTDGDTGDPATFPDDLRQVEEVAEDAYDKALVGDFAAVAADAQDLDTHWQAYRGRAEDDGASPAELDAMDQAIAGLAEAAASPVDRPTVARAANAVSSGMDELFALYDPVVPADVLALDYLGREVVLDGMQLDFAAASSDTDLIDARWNGVRAAVLDAGGASEADEYAASIATLRDAIAAMNDTMLIDDANVGLELVDAIEGVFEH